MTLTFSRITIELTGTYLYIDHAGTRAVFLKFSSGFAFSDFEMRREAGHLELWGLGMHCIANWPGRRVSA